MMVIAVVAIAVPPVPPLPGKPVGKPMVGGGVFPPFPPFPAIAVALFRGSVPLAATAVAGPPVSPGWPSSPGLTPSAPFAPSTPMTVTSSARTPAALAVIRAKESPVVCNSRIKNER
jgi:hypothetical protein